MSRQSDDHIEKLIRQKLDSYQPAYNPEAWNRLNSRLGKEKLLISSKTTYALAGFIAGLALMFGVYYFMPNDSQKVDTTLKQSAIIEELSQLKEEVEELKRVVRSKEAVRNTFNQSSTADAGWLYRSPVKYEYIYIQQPSGNIHSNKKGIQLNKMRPVFNIPTTQFSLATDSLIQSGYHNQTQSLKSISNKRKHAFNIHWPDLKFQHSGYKHFTGPDRVFVSATIQHEAKIMGMQTRTKGVSIGLIGKISDILDVYGAVNYGLSEGSKSTKLWYDKYEWSDTVVIKSSISDSTWHHSLNWKYLDIPIGIQYQLLSNRKHSFALDLTGISRIYLNEEYQESLVIKGNVNQQNIIKFEAGERIHLFNKLRLGLRYNWKFKDHWDLSLHSFYNFPLRKHSYVHAKNRSWGVEMGLIYQFKGVR